MLLDEAVEVPLLGVRVGLDALLGLLPGWGDAIGAGLAGWIVVSAARLGAPGVVVGRMLLNLLLDTLLGAVPLLGDLFDVGYRANRRNVDLLEAHLDRPAGARRGSALVVWSVAASVALVVSGVLAGSVWLFLRIGGWLLP